MPPEEIVADTKKSAAELLRKLADKKCMAQL
jgi:hypothetical protein